MLKRYKVLLFVATLLALLVFISFTPGKDFKIVRYMDVFYAAFKEVNYWYVEDTDPKELMEGAIHGMLETLDPYTSYIPAEDEKDFEFLTTGQYGGIGAIISQRESYALVSEPYQGFPADRAGLKAGDQIIAIDNEPSKGLSIKAVSHRLRGMPGSKVLLQVVKPITEDTVVVRITREEISISSISYASIMQDSIAYILLSQFTKHTGQELRKTVQSLQEEAPLSSIIIDLRNNAGGLLDEAVEVANVFLPEDEVIVKTKGKIEQFNKTYKTKKEAENDSIPLLILVNGRSASASEIIAGSIQDLDRGIIVGERTFGKGLVQSTRPLSYDAQIKITTAHYYIPSGRCIQALDFSHKTEDGHYEKIADSLIHTFQTRKGRIVYDGKGIRPDIHVASETLADISRSLFSNHLIFDFATQFYYTRDSFPCLDSLAISEKIWNEFLTFLDNKEYDYATQIEKKLKELTETAKKENLYSYLEEELSDIEKEIQQYKQNDLEIHKEQISHMLQEEIAKRYFYQQGAVQTALMSDPQLEKALNILGNLPSYHAILDPQQDSIIVNQ